MARESSDDRGQDATTRTTSPEPWWLQGDEECPHCEQSYAVEMEVRCVDCDAPICPLCVVRVEIRSYCPSCGVASTAQGVNGEGR